MVMDRQAVIDPVVGEKQHGLARWMMHEGSNGKEKGCRRTTGMFEKTTCEAHAATRSQIRHRKSPNREIASVKSLNGVNVN